MDLGVMSIPCCMNAPSANQRLLITLKWLLTCLPRHKYVDEVQKSLQRELPLFLTLTLLSATHTGKTLRTKGLSLSCKVSENTYYYIGLIPTLHAQCAVCIVRCPCGISAIAVKTPSHGKTIFLRLFFLCSFMKKT